MKSIIILMMICGLVVMPKNTFAAASLSDMFVTPNGDLSFFGGYLGGDGDWSDPNGALDWAIGNRTVFSPLNTEDLVISTCVGDWHLPADWLERMRITKDGFIGIRTSRPSAELEVNGNIIANAPTANNHVATKAYVDAQAGGGEPFMISAESPSYIDFTHTEAVNYCRELSAPCEYMIDGTCTQYVDYTDWKMPTIDELALFYGMEDTYQGLWTRTISGTTDGSWVVGWLMGGWSSSSPSLNWKVRCVR